MNIQGIGQNKAAQTPTRQGNPRLDALDKQISNLQKNIQEVHKNEKMDPKTKMDKVKEYQDQIQMIQQEKAQIQAEERQSKLKANENKQPSMAQEENAKDHVVDENVQNAFVKMDSAKSTASSLGVAREQAKGELRIAESKSFLRRPGSTPEAAAKARATLAKVDGAIQNEIAKTVSVIDEENKNTAPTPQDGTVEQEYDTENITSGTGRMEPGQFLNDEA